MDLSAQVVVSNPKIGGSFSPVLTSIFFQMGGEKPPTRYFPLNKNVCIGLIIKGSPIPKVFPPFSQPENFADLWALEVP